MTYKTPGCELGFEECRSQSCGCDEQKPRKKINTKVLTKALIIGVLTLLVSTSLVFFTNGKPKLLGAEQWQVNVLQQQ